jgi:hypothetical protein
MESRNAGLQSSHARATGVQRSEEAKREFMRESGYPHGRKGYVVDHIVPLASGGADAPSNMQWQTIADGKAKDKVERHSSVTNSRSPGQVQAALKP